jgi:bifunctional DNA-binding transcriptional regulator/antitoxin component of YhaV-PrlF toxin-antitoxin module
MQITSKVQVTIPLEIRHRLAVRGGTPRISGAALSS